MRAETGSLQFEDDWAGVFIRGDDALYYAMILNEFLNGLTEEQKQDVFGFVGPLQGLLDLLKSAHQGAQDPNRQYLKCFEKCLKK